jgi:hypothetical protein
MMALLSASCLCLLGQEYNIQFGPRGGTEILRPTSDSAAMSATSKDKACANACDGAEECFEDIDEDPAGAGDNLHVQSATGQQAVFDFDTPAQNPSQAANSQRFNVLVSACTDSGHSTNPCQEDGTGLDPSLYVYVYCAGVKQNPPIYNENIGGDLLDELHQIDWTMDAQCAVDGSDTAIGLNTSGVDAGDDARVTCWEAAEWVSTY